MSPSSFNLRGHILFRPKILSTLFFVIGVIGIYMSTVIRNPYTVQLPLAIIGGSLLFSYLKFGKKHDTRKLTYGSGKILTLTFFIVTTIIITLYYFNGFWRDNLIIKLTFLLYILAAAHIFSSSSNELSLILIMIAGVINRVSAYYSSSGFVGIDIYQHSQWIESIITYGSIEGLSDAHYYYAPFYHIQAAVGELFYAVTTQDAIALSVILSVTIVPPVYIFILTRTIWTTQTGLIAAYLYIVSDYGIYWGVHVIPTSIGLVFFTIALVNMLFYYVYGDKRRFGVLVSTLFALVFTHQVSLFITIVSVLTITCFFSLYTNKLSTKFINIASSSILIILLDFIITKYQGPGSQSFFDFVLGNLITSVLSTGSTSRPENALPADPNISLSGAAAVTDIQILGTSILLLLAICGSLCLIRHSIKKEIPILVFSLGGGVTALFFFTLVFPVIGVRTFLPDRWWAFIYVLLVTFSAPALVFIVKNSQFCPRQEKTQVLIILVVVSIFTVLMVGSAVGTPDNPYIESGFSAERLSLTESEVSMGDHYDSYKAADITASSDQRYPYGTRTIQMNYQNPNSVSSDEPKLILHRKYLTSTPAQYIIILENERWRVHGGFPINAIDLLNKNSIYHNGDDEILLVYDR